MTAQTLGVTRRPSSTDRWLGTEAEPGCTASVMAVKDCPVDFDGNSASRLGTIAHALFYHSTRDGKDPGEYIGQEFPGEVPAKYSIPVTDEMADHVRNAQEYVETVLRSGKVIMRDREVTLPIKFGQYIESGKSDEFALMEDGTLHDFDLKYGMMKVPVHDNPQLQMYSASLVQWLERLGVTVKNIVVHILQPRKDSYTSYTVSRDQLEAFLQRAHYAAVESETQNPDGSFGVFRPSSKACMWCPIKKTCRARAASAATVVGRKFGLENNAPAPLEAALDADLPAAFNQLRSNELTKEEIEGLYPHLKRVKELCDDIADAAFAIAVKDPGAFKTLKLVAGNDSRKFIGEKARVMVALAESGLTSDEFEKEPELLTAAQAEAALVKKYKKVEGKRRYMEHLLPVVNTTKGEEKPLLVPETDPRDRLNLQSTADKMGIPA